MQIWRSPEWRFGGVLSGRLAVAFYRFGPTLAGRLSGRLGVPPSNQQPATTTASISVTSICTVTSARRATVTDRQMDRWSEKSRRAACGQRCEVAA